MTQKKPKYFDPTGSGKKNWDSKKDILQKITTNLISVDLPTNFTWRNVSGTNYLTTVLN